MYEGRQEPGTLLLLCAVKLAFDHPSTGQRMIFEIPPPIEIQRAMTETPPA
jgi:hypothetical protein